jgi:hypothetical protein
MTREGFQNQVPVLDVVAVARAWPPLIFLLKARRPEKYRDSIAVKTGDHDGGSESGIAPRKSRALSYRTFGYCLNPV